MKLKFQLQKKNFKIYTSFTLKAFNFKFSYRVQQIFLTIKQIELELRKFKFKLPEKILDFNKIKIKINIFQLHFLRHPHLANFVYFLVIA